MGNLTAKSLQTSEGRGQRPEQTDRSTAIISERRRRNRREVRRWWMKLLLQPILLLAASAILLGGLGIAQRLGWSGSGSTHDFGKAAVSEAGPDRYVCPMMCTPAQSEPGRCPVCAMELVPATSGVEDGNSRSIQIDPVARRVAGIRTVPVKAISTNRTIHAIGELGYDEGTLRTISAYVDGRIERLYADFTGVHVSEGDYLALIFSPRLYSGQVEFLLAKKNDTRSRSTRLQKLIPSSGSLSESARQRLIELGMTESQISELEASGKPNSRLHIAAPISGTVIEKLAVDGDYIKEGQPIYRLADLNTVWLTLDLFPDDAATVRYGQKVAATVQSLPGEHFFGRVAFIDANVDPSTRTVGIRVVIPNPQGRLRVGDFAKATIDIPFVTPNSKTHLRYDPDLADKWISPRHPHIVRSSPGNCPLCGVDLVPASQFGFTADPMANPTTLVIPRDAVLMAGDNSVVYVEIQPGRFELRRVTLGPTSDTHISVLDGVIEGENVAVRGNFLIDSQMQLAGNPSLIDPSKLDLPEAQPLSPEIITALAKLSPNDRILAERQGTCPISGMPLGSMGVPLKVDVNGTAVFICCDGCRAPLLQDPEKYLAKLAVDSTEDKPADDLPPMDQPPIMLPVLPSAEPATVPTLENQDDNPGPPESDNPVPELTRPSEESDTEGIR